MALKGAMPINVQCAVHPFLARAQGEQTGLFEVNLLRLIDMQLNRLNKGCVNTWSDLLKKGF